MIEWKIASGTQEHTVVYYPPKEVGEHRLVVDGVKIEIEASSYIPPFGFEQEFEIDDKTYYLVVSGGFIDIVINGRYIDSKNRHRPLRLLRIDAVLAIVVLLGALSIVQLQPPAYIAFIVWVIDMALIIWCKGMDMKSPFKKRK